MLKSLKKAAMVLLSLCLVLQIAACGNKDASKSGVDADLEQDTIITQEPVEFTYFHSASKAEDGQWDVLKEAAKMTNVSLNVTVSKSNSDFTQAFNLMLASGELTDIVESYTASAFTKYGVEGAFVALNEYFDSCMPHFKKFLEENPEVKKAITSYDGNIYYIPFIQDGNASRGWFFREDWLEKLGLKAPATKEELYDVLCAFRDKDPNGNGQKDEIPYFNGFMGKTDFSGLECLYTLWNAWPSWYQEKGTVKFGPYEPEYKEAIKNVSKWYKEGLIDKEIFTRGSNARAELLGKNVGGSTHDWFGSTANFNKSLADKIEGFSFVPVAPPEGREPARRAVAQPYGWAISTSCKDIEIAAKYFDFWFTEKGHRLINFGIEGVHYDMVDGKPVFKPELLAQDNFQSIITEAGVQLDIGYKQTFDYEIQWLHPLAVEGIKMYEENDYFIDIFPSLSSAYTPDEFEQYTALYTPIKTYIDETVQKWILGVNDVDATYDAFISQLKTMNIDEMIKIQQKVYDRYNKN